MRPKVTWRSEYIQVPKTIQVPQMIKQPQVVQVPKEIFETKLIPIQVGLLCKGLACARYVEGCSDLALFF
jgi:hypothetical protein